MGASKASPTPYKKKAHNQLMCKHVNISCWNVNVEMNATLTIKNTSSIHGQSRFPNRAFWQSSEHQM